MQKSTRTFNLLTDACGILAIVLILGTFFCWFIQRPVFLLRGVDVHILGVKDAINSKLLAQTLKGKIVGNYFTADINAIKNELKTLPWVNTASVSRVWPNKLNIELKLYKPVAIWAGTEILSSDGIIFEGNPDIAEAGGRLPQIDGPKQKAFQIYERYVNLEKICRKYGFDIVSLNLSELGGWTLKFYRPGDKVKSIVFKANETDENMDKILESVLRRMSNIREYLGVEPRIMDARYSKGIAIKKTEEELVAEEALERKDGR